MHLPVAALPGALGLLADPAGQAIAAQAFGRRVAGWMPALSQFTMPVQAPTLLNSWVDFGSGFGGSGYWKEPDGTVHLRGLVKSGVIGSPIFTLPAGFRAAVRESFPCVSNGALGIVEVNTTGDVTAVAGANVYVSLAGISFRTP